MTLEDLADLIRANSANTNGRIDGLRAEANAALMNIQNDLTDVRGDITNVRAELTDVRGDVGEIRGDVTEIRRALDLASIVSTMQRRIDAPTEEVAELKRRAS